ncbi:MAG: four helix bundle protein [Chloroflexi bacterium]|nr:four helix bundle protein [Chloroflexota bacterium]
MDAALDFQEALFDANARSGVERLAYLTAADAHLDKLRLYLRLVHQWDWLTISQYQHVSAMVAEIGRLLGGWLRQTLSPLQ